MTTTAFAPAERVDDQALQTARAAFMANPVATALLEAMTEMAVIVNPQRQIIAANRHVLAALEVDSVEEIVGIRPGEAIGCVYANENPGGCGTGHHCIDCGAVKAMVECLRMQQSVTRECRLLVQTTDGVGALNLEVAATFLTIDGTDMIVIAMRDTGAEKRRQVLERIFFHDVLNTVTGIRMVSELMETADAQPELMTDLKATLAKLASQLADEVTAQHQLLIAEQGELRLTPIEVMVDDILQDMRIFYLGTKLSQQRLLEVDGPANCRIATDPAVLRRVLSNLVKNALEATGPGGTVTLSAECRSASIVFCVSNPGVMPEAVQRQIFQRAFTTKEGSGRGLGTYSVKLLTERYLEGCVTFTSNATDGTTFAVELPLRLAADADDVAECSHQ